MAALNGLKFPVPATGSTPSVPRSKATASYRMRMLVVPSRHGSAVRHSCVFSTERIAVELTDQGSVIPSAMQVFPLLTPSRTGGQPPAPRRKRDLPALGPAMSSENFLGSEQDSLRLRDACDVLPGGIVQVGLDDDRRAADVERARGRVDVAVAHRAEEV